MVQQTFRITTFVTPSGAPLSGGCALIRLNMDAQSPSGQICGGMAVNIPLNSSGVPETFPQFWTNAALNPSGTEYLLCVHGRRRACTGLHCSDPSEQRSQSAGADTLWPVHSRSPFPRPWRSVLNKGKQARLTVLRLRHLVRPA